METDQSGEYGLNNGQTAIVQEHLRFAKGLARKFYLKRIRGHLDLDDVESSAYLGLCQAASRFNEKKNVEFKSFSYLRIVGSMYDQYVLQSDLSRASFKRSQEIKNGTAKEHSGYPLATKVSDLGTLRSVIEDWGVSIKVSRDNSHVDLTYLDEEEGEGLHERREVQRIVREAISLLPEVEQRLVHAKYFEGLTIDEIRGEFPEMSRSGISRANSRALEFLKDTLAPMLRN